MFWSIFFDSLILILAILAVGWIIAYLIESRGRGGSSEGNRLRRQ